MTRAYYDVDDVRPNLRRYLNPGWGLTPHIIGADVTAALDFDPQPQRPLCAEVDPELFFPEKGQYSRADSARRICHACPIESYCLQRHLGEEYGIWGGKTHKQRQQMRARLRRGAAA